MIDIFPKKTALRGALVVILSLFMLAGCAGQKKKEKKTEFFDKWKTKADQSWGYSPSPRKRALDIPSMRPAEQDRISSVNAPPLPTNPITMKMNSTDVSVLLRALARAAGEDIIISEGVLGNLDIDVDKVPWDQVFLGILKSQGLTYEWQGGIIRIVTPVDQQRELEHLETKQKLKAKNREISMVDPLVTQVVPIDYADAKKLKASLESFLSEKAEGVKIGSVIVDDHTNSVIIQAIPADLARIVPIIETLDKPTPQILIEAHIIETSKGVARELGIRWGGLYSQAPNYYVTSGSGTGAIGVAPGDVSPVTGNVVNLPTPSTDLLGLSLGFVATNLGGSVLALQLSALEEEGKLNILSSPSVTTVDNQPAMIESGKEIPYQSVEDKEVKIEYKPAVLSLEVTPHVIGDDSLKLDIFTTKDDVDFAESVQGNPTIRTKRARTKVIVFNGQTTVIGGLSKEDTSSREEGVPFLRNLPIFGYLFKSKTNEVLSEELLIFITPHILRERPKE